MKILDRIIEVIAAGLLFITAVVTFFAVIMRYVFDSSLSFSFELLSILLTYITFVSAYLALRKNEHLRIDFIIGLMPAFFQKAIFVFTNLVMLCVTGVMIYWGFLQALKFPEQVTEIMRIPISAIYIIIPLSGTAMFVQILLSFTKEIVIMAKGLKLEK